MIIIEGLSKSSPLGCSRTINGTYGNIHINSTSGYYETCQWTILSASIPQAVALVSVQELNLVSCR